MAEAQAESTDASQSASPVSRRSHEICRDSKTDPFLLPYYDAWNLVEEHAAAGVALNRYIHGAGIDEIVARISASGTAVYFHQDALGSTIALTDVNGSVIERYKYDVFGAPRFFDGAGATLSSSGYDNRFLFTGREYHQTVGVYDYRNRFYSPSLGRFLQTDPLRFAAGDIDLYRYTGNNSVSRLDPTGLYWMEWGVTIGGFVGGGLALIGSVPADFATGGLNIFATPAEVGAAASLGALIGGGIGTWLDANSRSNPLNGTPGGTSTIYQPNGKPKQIREYGDDGYPDRDTDFDHPHNGIQPHEHNWAGPKMVRPQPMKIVERDRSFLPIIPIAMR